MKFKKSFVLLILLISGLFFFAGCSENLFKPESNIKIVNVETYGGHDAVVVDTYSQKSWTEPQYEVKVTFRILGPTVKPGDTGGKVGATITGYKLEYYEPDGTKVDYFEYAGETAYLYRAEAMNLYVSPPIGKSGDEDYSEAARPICVITDDVWNYRQYKGDKLTHLSVKITFTVEDDNENCFEIPSTGIRIEFQYTG